MCALPGVHPHKCGKHASVCVCVCVCMCVCVCVCVCVYVLVCLYMQNREWGVGVWGASACTHLNRRRLFLLLTPLYFPPLAPDILVF